MQTVTWVELFKFVGGGAALLAATAWLVRSIISQFLSKDIEKFKFDLKRESDQEVEFLKSSLAKEVETLKSSLSTQVQKNQIRFSILHKRRVELIEELYYKIIDLETSATLITREIADYNEDDKDLKFRADKFIDEFLALNSFMCRNTLYFPSEISGKIHEFNYPEFNLSLDINYASRSEDVSKSIDAFEKNRKAFNSLNSTIKKIIETEFRAFLGVE
jgi:hypothetical protein